MTALNINEAIFKEVQEIYPQIISLEMLDLFPEVKLHFEKYYVSQGMVAFGGGFVRPLGVALAHADGGNAKLIEKTWPDLWKQYLEMGYDLEHSGKRGKEVA